MNTVKHTPGPWHRGSDELSSPELWSDVYAPNGFIVARVTVDRGENSKERAECHAIARANADLMAAAPDLLEAVTMARTAFASIANGIHAPEKYAHKCALAMDGVLAILSKATHPAPYNTAPESAHVVGSEEQEGGGVPDAGKTR